MKNNHNTPLNSPRLRQITLTSLALAFFALISMSAEAQNGTVASFDLSISSSELVLAFPDDPMVMHFQAWDSPLTRLIERNMPFIQLTNTSTNGVNLTDFRLTIGDEMYNFTDEVLGNFAVVGSTSPNGVIASASGGGTGDNANELEIAFGNGGIAPGETIRFQIDLNPDSTNTDAFIYPDFRSVLFDVNTNSADNDSSDNALATALFSATGEAEPLEVSRRFQDVTTTDHLYMNENIRPYSIMEMIEVFELQIPEPTSAALLAFASAGLATIGRRRGR